MVAVFIVLDWTFLSMNSTTMIPLEHVPRRKLAIESPETTFTDLVNKDKI